MNRSTPAVPGMKGADVVAVPGMKGADVVAQFYGIGQSIIKS